MKDVLCSIIAFGAFVKVVKSFGSQQALRSASLKQEIGKAALCVRGGLGNIPAEKDREKIYNREKKRRNKSVH